MNFQIQKNIQMKTFSPSWITKSFQMVVLFSAIKTVVYCQTDTFTPYFAQEATAFDIDYDTDTIIFATDALELKVAGLFTQVVSVTLTTIHKATINSIALSDDGSMVLTGGRDYKATVIDISGSTMVCGWDEIRGEVISSTFFSDNLRIAFATMEGYLYYSDISDCVAYRVNLGGIRPVSISSISTNNEVWIADYDNKIYTVDISTQLFTTKATLPTSKTQSVVCIPAASLVAVCTQKAFYLLNSANGAVLHTKDYPTMYTKTCRIRQNPASATQFYLTAVPEQQFNRQTSNYPIWSIWVVDTSSGYTTSLVHQQFNSGNQYGTSASTMIQLYDAAVISVTPQLIYVANIAPGKSPYLNKYGSPTTPCSSGYYSNGGSCEKCNWNHDQRYNCDVCSASGECSSCLSFSYRVVSGGMKLCPACPNNCYRCSDASTCTSCVGGYSLVSSSCQISNNTGCLATDYTSGITKCYECEFEYYLSPNVTCIECKVAFPGCLQCDRNKCFRCSPGYVIVNGVEGNCQLCEHWIKGCAACLNQTYCDTCFDQYPYFDTISATARICMEQCHYTCLTCNHYQYDQCISCDANRTLLPNSTCVCLPDYPFEDPNHNNQCTACEDFIQHCQECSSTTFCDVCDEASGFYLNDINATHQQCQLCNYTCGSCSTGGTWYNCSTCDPGDMRSMESSNGYNMCVCQSMSYFEVDGEALCEFCEDHISNCDICINSTMCITCYAGYYLVNGGAGVRTCSPCSLPCTQCFATSSNCTHCASGRQLNQGTNKCVCLEGYYPTGTTSCASCSSVLGSCEQCTNDTQCITCWPGTYFVMVNGTKQCDMCQSTCLTCDTWNDVCATCDALAHRVLNPSNDQCECETGYTQTDGRCLNCGATFDFCTSCNITVCFTCEPGYSLAYGGLKCIDCETTYPGCILCLDGKCAACNTSIGYELGYSRCICQPGYYKKELDCLPYKMGAKIQRLFPVYESYSQVYGEDMIKIRFYFGCEQLFTPYGLENSFKVSINEEEISPSVSQDNTSVYLQIPVEKDVGRAKIQVEIINNTIYDTDEYQPDQLTFLFHKNIFYNSTYDLATNFQGSYASFILPATRILATSFLLIGGADLVILLVMTLHILPAFLLLKLTIPPPLQHMLSIMMQINEGSLFLFADAKTGVQTYQTAYENKYAETYGLHGSIMDIKAMDIVTALCILGFYFVLGPALLKYVPEGKPRKWWEEKFIKKRYATSANIIICFMPSVLLAASVNFNMQNFSTSVSFSVGVSAVFIAIICIFVFLHGLVLLSTQFSQEHKTQECYLGSSSLQPKSVLYVLSILLIATWAIPLLCFVHPVASTTIIICLLLWHMKFFRNWDSFPSKIYFFVRLFYCVCLLIVTSTFLIFSVSELFQTAIGVSTLELLGLCDLVLILILLAFSFLEVIFLFLLTFYRLCKGSSNMVDNIATQKSQSEQDPRNDEETSIKNAQQYAYNVRSPGPPQVEELDEAYYRGSNKQQHMKKFKDNHFRTINDGFGGSRIKSVKDLQNSTYVSTMGGTGNKYYRN